MLLTKMYDYGWAKVSPAESRTPEFQDLEQAMTALFGDPRLRPVLYRVKYRVNTCRFRSKVRRSVHLRGRVWHREMVRRDRRNTQWPAAKKKLNKIPSRGPVGRSRKLLLARSRRIYGE